ncbi:MAG TPA: glycosyltransferase [Pyrinomonadaceae bacterium]|nr:glycosyltransferase [Pyrinomonadaceae bacterium]
MPKYPKASVCIPSYNHARFLPEAIESALRQTYPNVEVVIVDDGSADGSLRIARDYETRHPDRVRVFTHPGHANRGISATVNLAFEKATGVYYSGLPSDDVLYPDKIERQVAFLEARPEVGFVYGPYDLIDDAGRMTGTQRIEDLSADADPLERMVEINVVPGVTVLARREQVARVYPHAEGLVYSDWEFWARFLALAPVGFLDRPLVKYRVHGSNTSVGIEPARHLSHTLAVIEALRRRAPELGNEKFGALLDLRLAHLRYCAGDPEGAARDLKASAAFGLPAFERPDAFAAWVESRGREPFHPAGAESPDSGFGPWAVAQLRPVLGASFASAAGRLVTARLCAEDAFRSHATDPARTREMVLRCLRNDPRWLGDRALRSLAAEALVGRGLMNRVRRLKGRLAGGGD